MATNEQLDAATALDEIVRFVIRRNTVLREVSFTAAGTMRTLDVEGPCRLTDLAEREGVSQPSMTAMVSRLERQGFVRREQDASDRRIVLVSVTEAGRDVLARRRDTRVAFLAHLVGELGEGDQAALTATVPALRRLLDPSRVPGALAAAEQANTDSVERQQ